MHAYLVQCFCVKITFSTQQDSQMFQFFIRLVSQLSDDTRAWFTWRLCMISFFFEKNALCVMLEFAVGAVVSVEKNVSSATHRRVICKFNCNNDQSVSL